MKVSGRGGKAPGTRLSAATEPAAIPARKTGRQIALSPISAPLMIPETVSEMLVWAKVARGTAKFHRKCKRAARATANVPVGTTRITTATTKEFAAGRTAGCTFQALDLESCIAKPRDKRSRASLGTYRRLWEWRTNRGGVSRDGISGGVCACCSKVVLDVRNSRH